MICRRVGGAGAHPHVHVHVHVAPTTADCGGGDTPDVQPPALQTQFQTHVVGSVPDVGATETPVPADSAAAPPAETPGRLPTTVLDCVTGPSSPGLLMRIATFRFVGATWPAVATAAAVASDRVVCAAASTAWGARPALGCVASGGTAVAAGGAGAAADATSTAGGGADPIGSWAPEAESYVLVASGGVGKLSAGKVLGDASVILLSDVCAGAATGGGGGGVGGNASGSVGTVAVATANSAASTSAAAWLAIASPVG